MWFFVDELESGLLIDAMGGDEYALRPERDSAVSDRAREANAFVDESFAEAESARSGLDEEQTQLRRVGFIGMVHKDDPAERDSVPLGDPAAVALGLLLIDEVGGDACDERFGGFVPAVFLSIESAVALDDPTHV